LFLFFFPKRLAKAKNKGRKKTQIDISVFKGIVATEILIHDKGEWELMFIRIKNFQIHE
jgi:hypothetical protein